MRTSARLASLLVLSLVGCRDVEIPMPQSGSIDGSVVSQGRPVDALTLVLTPESGDAKEAVTAADGHFHLDGLKPGLWTLTARRTGFIPLERTFTVTNGQTRDLGQLTLFSEAADEAAGTLSGTVETAGAPEGAVQGATVEALLQPEGNLLATTAIGTTGLFALQVPPGRYTLRVTHPYFVNAMATDIDVQPRQRVLLAAGTLVMQLNPGRVVGRVVEEVDGRPTRDPAANVTVSSDTGASTTTAADGTFTLAGLPGGARQLRFSKADRHTTFTTLAVAVEAGKDTALMPDVELFLDRGDAVGTVEMGDGTPMRDVTVSIDGTSYSASAAPATSPVSRGTFRITGLPVGDYTLTATRAGYRSVSSGVFRVSANRQNPAPALPLLTRVQGDFVLDDLDPVSAAGFTRTQNVVLQVNDPTGVAAWRAAEGDVSALAFQPFGADGGTGISFQLSAGDGEKTVFLQLRDSMGAQGPVLSASIVLDTTAPIDLALRVGEGTGFIAVTNPLPFTLTGVDPGSAAASGIGFMRLSTTLDGQGNPSNARIPYLRDDVFNRASTTQGPVTIHAQLVDNAGNASAVTTATVVVDTLPPVGTIMVQQGAGATQAGVTSNPVVTLLVNTTGEPNGGLVRVRLGNTQAELLTATPQAATMSMTAFLDQASDGPKEVWYRFVDSAGNLSAPASAMIALDRTAPTPLAPALVLATLASSSVTNTLAGSWTASARDERALSPTEAVQLEIDGVAQTPTPPTSSTTVTGALGFTLPGTDGLHTVRLTFKDAAGNLASTPLTTVTLDRVAPTGRFSLTGRTADNLPVSSDTAGAVVSSQVVRVDLVQEGATGVFLSNAAIASCATVPAGSFIAPGSASLLTWDLGTANGSVTVRGCLRDLAGNVTTLATATLVVDGLAPTGCALVLPGVGLNGVTPPAGFTASRSVNASLTGCSQPAAEVAVIPGAGAPTCTAAGLPWAPLSSLSNLQLGNDGLQTFQACVRDGARNVAAVTAASITLDTTPPTGAQLSLNAGADFINATQVTGGMTTVSVVGLAQGATDWTVGTAPATGTSQAFTSGAPRSVPGVAVVDGAVLTLYARFRDAVGNVSDASDDIRVDVTPPAAPTVSVRWTGSPGYLNTEASTVLMTAPGATSLQLAEGADLTACTTSLGASAQIGVLPSYTVVLSGPDGSKTVCARASDAAGNPSAVGSTSIVLDRVAPPAPVLLTPNRAYNPFTSTGTIASTVHLRNIVDPGHLNWRVTGTTYSMSTALNPGAPVTVSGVSALPFTIFVNNNSSVEAGVLNEFSFVEEDRAGNLSAAVRLALTLDGNSPEPVGLRPSWLENGRDTGSFQWTVSPSPDVAEYLVYYGSTPGNPQSPASTYFGTAAGQGTSPIRVAASVFSPGGTQRLQLTNLPTGSLTYVTVVPVDRAGNVGQASLDGGVQEIVFENDIVSANFMAEQPLFPGAVQPDGGPLPIVVNPSLEASGDVVWAAGLGNGHLVLSSASVAPLHGSYYQGNFYSSSTPLVTTRTSVVDSVSAPQVATKLEWPWLFTASGSFIRIWNVSGATPVLVSELNCRQPAFPFNVTYFTSLDVRGNTLFATGTTGQDILVHVDLSSLYDNAVGAPTLASVRAAIQNGSGVPQELVWSRDRLLSPAQFTTSPGFDLTLALDSNQSTNLSATDRFFAANTFSNNRVFTPVVSGDLAVVASNTSLSIVGLQGFWNKVGPYFPEVARTNIEAAGQVQLFGDQLFYASAHTAPRLGSVSLATQSAPKPTGQTRSVSSAPFATGLAVTGNYALIATGATGPIPALLRSFELATPTTMHHVFSSGVAMGTPNLTNGFAVGATGQVVDFLGGVNPLRRGTPSSAESCVTDGIVVDDTLVSTNTTTLRVTRLDDSFGRVANPQTVTSTSQNFSPPIAERVLGIDRLGNYAVVVAARNTAPVSLWVEVYRLSALRSQATNAVRTLSAADKLGEFQFDTVAQPYNNVALRVRMTNHHAVVTFRSRNVFGAPAAWILDLRPLIDDNPGTTMNANHIVGRVVEATGAQMTDGKLSGSTLYLIGDDRDVTVGLFTFDAWAAFDTDLATKVTENDLLSNPSFPIYGPQALDVVGSTAVVLGGTLAGDALIVLDVSDPEAPMRLASTPMPRPLYLTCNFPFSLPPMSSVRLAGTRAYVGTDSYFEVVELE